MATDAEAAPLSSAEIQARLRTRTLARSLHVYDEVDSTNETALGLAASGAPGGTVIIADRQTAGRGRLGRTWYSPPGTNLYCSILLRPSLPSNPFSTWLCWLPLVVGIGVLRAIRRATCVEGSLKWPNDVLVGHRKVAGILCESIGMGSPAICVVVGIGININTAEEEFPGEIAGRVTSLASTTGRHFSRPEVAAALFNDLEPLLDPITSETPTSVLQEYASVCSTIGRKIRVTLASGEIVEGFGQALTSEGALLVLPVGTKQPRMFYSADVKHIR